MLGKLIRKYPDKDWDWEELTNNPAISIKDVVWMREYDPNFDDILLDCMENLSQNPGISLEDIIEHPELEWNIAWLSKNPNVEIQDLANNPESLLKFYYDFISKTPIEASDIKLECYFDGQQLAQNPNLTMKLITRNEKTDPNWYVHWYWPALSRNPNIDINFVVRYQKMYWDWFELGRNPNITIQDIENNLNLPWDFEGIMKNRTLTVDFILRHFNNIRGVAPGYKMSSNPNITFEDIMDNPIIPWDIDGISSNPNITLQNMLDTPFIPWNWIFVSSNPSITMHDIENHPEIPWSFDMISLNPNITMSFIDKHIDKINFSNLSQNDFNTKKIINTLIKKKRDVKPLVSLLTGNDYIKTKQGWIKNKTKKSKVPNEIGEIIEKYLFSRKKSFKKKTLIFNKRKSKI